MTPVNVVYAPRCAMLIQNQTPGGATQMNVINLENGTLRTTLCYAVQKRRANEGKKDENTKQNLSECGGFKKNLLTALLQL